MRRIVASLGLFRLQMDWREGLFLCGLDHDIDRAAQSGKEIHQSFHGNFVKPPGKNPGYVWLADAQHFTDSHLCEAL